MPRGRLGARVPGSAVDAPKDARLTAYEHGADGEDLLSIGVGTDIAEAHTGQAAEGKVKGSDVGAAHCRAAHRAVDVGRLQTFAQLMEPPLNEEVEHERTTSKGYGSCHVCVSSVGSERDGRGRRVLRYLV